MRSLNSQHPPMAVTVCYKSQDFGDLLTAMMVLVMVSNNCLRGTHKLSLRLLMNQRLTFSD